MPNLPAPESSKPTRRFFLWLLSAVLVIVAMGIIFYTDLGSGLIAQTTVNSGLDHDGLLAIPAQLTRDGFGLYIIDPREGTICLYQYTAQRKLELVASRAFRYDLQLEDWNTKPSPREIQELISQQRRLDQPAAKPESAE